MPTYRNQSIDLNLAFNELKLNSGCNSEVHYLKKFTDYAFTNYLSIFDNNFGNLFQRIWSLKVIYRNNTT